MSNKIKLRRKSGKLKKKKQGAGQHRISSQHGILQKAFALHQSGRLSEAEILYKQILQAEPNHPDALHYLGAIAHQAGKTQIAAELMRKALGFYPNYFEAHNSLGVVLKDQGKLDEAIASFRRAITLKPDFAETHFNLGNTLTDQGKLDEAIASFRQAINLKPDYFEALNNLGNTLSDLGRLEEALASYRKALTLMPDQPKLLINIGVTLTNLGKLEEAIATYRKALALKPDYAEAHNNLGNVLLLHDMLDEALASCRQAVFLKPDYAEAHNNLGNALSDLGILDEAITSYRRAISLVPDFTLAHSNLLFCLNHLPNVSVADYLDEARDYGRKAAGKARECFLDWNCSANPERLRVGLVSGDLRNHPVGYFLESMLASIDSTRVELVAYPTYHKEDELTERIRPFFSAWKPVLGKSDAAAAKLIHEDGVHVLLDLAGHTSPNRLPLFAWKAAPVQATWLGYFASTGIAEMDYIIADSVSVPKSYQEQFTEQVWYLPDIRYCFTPPFIAEELKPAPLPALRNGWITFGCFQKLSKINDGVLTAWSRIFQLLPHARLRLQNGLFNSPAIRKQMQLRLTQSGIAPERVLLEKQVPRIDYLAAHAQIDIILDTFPFTGGTTTCEALWMGVPTLTLSGKTMLARQGASLLACAGLEDWITKDNDDYVAKAVAHAGDLDKLARLRAGLRQQVLASPLFDGPRFARNFEAAMWGMWQRFQAG